MQSESCPIQMTEESTLMMRKLTELLHEAEQLHEQRRLQEGRPAQRRLRALVLRERAVRPYA